MIANTALDEMLRLRSGVCLSKHSKSLVSYDDQAKLSFTNDEQTQLLAFVVKPRDST